MTRAPKPDVPTANKLLGLLPANEYDRLRTCIEPVVLEAGQVLLDRGKIDHVYFPISGVVTMFIRMADGDQIEAGMIGNEGMVPLCLFLGLNSTPFRAVVQNSGQALRIPAKTFDARVQAGYLFHSILLRFTATFMAQVSLSAACKRLHSLRAQYCRLLLMTHDRVRTSPFLLTQQAIAEMLGVRRMSVTAVANGLHDEGLIDYRRGRIRITDRVGLKKAACECYGRIRDVYKTLLISDSSGTRGGKSDRS
jgi:CRP-like cAMP-binding protein